MAACRRPLRCSLLAVWLLAGSAAASPGPRIRAIRPVPDLPYLSVEVEYPRGDAELTFTFEADGRPAPARAAGAGSEPSSRTASYLVFPGAACRRLVARWGPGPKERTAPAALRWKAPVLAVLLDRLGDAEALLQPVDLEVQVFPPASVVFLQDGAPLPSTVAPAAGPGQRLRVSPRWRPGPNAVRMRVRSPAGEIERTLTLVLLADGGLAPGQTARLAYGEVGSRSGPFYRLAVEGDAVAVAGDDLAEVRRAGADGWIGGGQVHVATLRAEVPGEAALRIDRKDRFLDGEYVPVTERRIRVGPAAPRAERLLGLRADAERGEIAFEVWTGGCTAREDFRVERTGEALALVRLRRDACKATPQRTTVSFTLQELGLRPHQPFTLSNPIVADPLAASVP